MADIGVVSSLADRILELMASAAMREAVVLWGVADEFQTLEYTIASVRSLLLEGLRGMGDLQEEQVKIFLEGLENVFYETDDFLNDSLAVAFEQSRLTPGKKIATKVLSFFTLTSSNPILFRRKMGYAIKQVTKVISDHRFDFTRNLESAIPHFPQETEVASRLRKQTSSFVHVEEVIGRDAAREAIMKQLFEHSSDEKVSVIAIVGAAGIGKTTLAQLVYNHPKVEAKFDLRMWVCVSDLVDVRLILQKLIESTARDEIVVDKGVYLQMDQLQKELRETINGRKFFLVLDGVRDESRANWLSLRNLLISGAKGSTVLVTTRSEKVAKITRTTAESFHLDPLSDEDSWLLLKRAFSGEAFEERDVKAEFEEIGRQIVEKCKGVPLVIRYIGRLLYGSDIHDWRGFVHEESIAEAMRNIGFQLEENDDRETKVATGMSKQNHSFVPEEEIIGRDADREAIMVQLLEHNSEEQVPMIAIVGAAGLGKTALAQLIFNDSRVQDYFDMRIWVCVTDVSDWRDIFEKILVSMTTEDPRDLHPEEMQSLISKEIRGKRFLLILDDVWSEKFREWLEFLMYLLSSGARGSRMIITARYEERRLTADEKHSHKLSSLDDDSAWFLFVKFAFERGEQPTNSKIIEIGKRIVANCEGNPLAIRTIGGILYSKNPETEWQPFYEKELSQVLKGSDILASVKLSYDHLPPHLKHCLAYCGLFPKDYEVDVQTLISLWMSQGLIEPSYEVDYEYVGYVHFIELLRRSFFQETMRDEWGYITKCKMQNFMCDLAKAVAPNACATLGLKEGIHCAKPRHVSFDFHLDSSWHIHLLAQSKRIRSLILPRQLQQEVESRSSESVCEEVTKFTYLRTLDLHNSGIKVMSASIRKLKLLRYLDLSQNVNIKALPNSIGTLWNLQTLKLNNCSNLQMLPGSIRKLVNLRTLENESCYCLTHMPQRLNQLSNLQTLSEFVLTKGTGSVSNQSAKLDELEELVELTGKLKLRNLKCSRGDKTARARLDQKRNLVSLALIWDMGTSVQAADCEESLEDLQPHPNLRELSLSAYKGVKFSSWLPLHENLVKLSLSRCVNCQCLPPLDHLPRLEVLLIDGLPELEYISHETYENEARAFFPSLKELQLTNLPKLVRWWQEATGMEDITFPCLSKLIIKDCPNLISMPLFPWLAELLVLKNTRWEPLQRSIITPQTQNTASEASSSSSSSEVTPSAHLSKLRTLCIINMPNGGPNMWQSLSSLRSLTFDHLQDIETFLEGLHEQVTSLQELHVWRCASLKEISWISNIRSLRILSLRLCPNLMIPRDKISLITSLQKVEIEECPKVSHIERMLEDRSYKE